MKTEANCTIHPVKMDAHYSGFGLTKREYFAAMAMQGICANLSSRMGPSEVAEKSVRIAEYLIERLNQQQP